MDARGILIVGGSGVVGRRIAADLAVDFPDRVIVAGRDFEKANATAASVGHGTRAREMDISKPSTIAAALDDLAVVVSCIDQPRRTLLHAVIDRGLAYTDITPHLSELGRGTAFEEIDAAARTSGARIVLGTGIVPGISSVMVRALADRLHGADEIETALVLSAGDVSGPASFDYFLQELEMPFMVHIDGADRAARPFDDPRLVEFPPPVGARTAFLFPFSDQVLYPRTMGAMTVRTRLALEPAWLAKLLAAAVRTGAARIVAEAHVRRLIAGQHRENALSASTRFALRVDVKRGERSSHATLVGHAQADAAAAGAAGVMRSLLEGEVTEPGAWMPEQVVHPEPFFGRLAARGLTVELPP